MWQKHHSVKINKYEDNELISEDREERDHQIANAMNPWSKVELLTHHPGGGHGEASGMVFSLRQGAGTGTTISSRDQNRDGGGTKVGFEKMAPLRGFLV